MPHAIGHVNQPANHLHYTAKKRTILSNKSLIHMSAIITCRAAVGVDGMQRAIWDRDMRPEAALLLITKPTLLPIERRLKSREGRDMVLLLLRID